VVLDRGKIVDQGSHNELMRRCELYRRLATAIARVTNPAGIGAHEHV